MLGVLVADAAAGQRFGQWSWTGFLGARQQAYDNRVTGTGGSNFSERELALSLGLNGFVVHPAIARFRLGVDLLGSKLGDGHRRSSNRLGYEGNLELLPRGKYPLRLSARRESYRYGDLASTDPYSFVATPDTVTSWGGRLRVRGGPLLGSLVGFDRSQLAFVDRSVAAEVHDRQFGDWSRSGKRFQQHLRLERSRRNFSAVGLAIEDRSLNLEERGDLARGWRWELSGVGLWRATEMQSGSRQGARDLRLTNRLEHQVRGRDALEVRYDGEVSRIDPSGRELSHLLGLVYYWRPRAGWEVGPFAEMARRTGETDSLQAPRGGVRVSWGGRAGTVDGLLTGTVSYGTAHTQSAHESRDSTFVAYSAIGSIGHGARSGLREELEVGWSHNDLNLRSQPLRELPDLGGRRLGLAVEDALRARLKLALLRNGRSLSTWGEWSRRESSDELAAREPVQVQTLSATAQLGLPRFNLVGNLGRTRLEQAGAPTQTVDYWSGALAWRPWRAVHLEMSYRDDRRQLAALPSIEGIRYEAGASLRMGLLTLEAHLFHTEERLARGPRRQNDGLRWSIGRRFGGWLPIVTGGERRGSIR